MGDNAHTPGENWIRQFSSACLALTAPLSEAVVRKYEAGGHTQETLEAQQGLKESHIACPSTPVSTSATPGVDHFCWVDHFYQIAVFCLAILT